MLNITSINAGFPVQVAVTKANGLPATNHSNLWILE